MDEILNARRTAVGMAALVSQGLSEEYELLFSTYLEDCNAHGLCPTKALALLAQASLALAVLAADHDTEYFLNMAGGLAVKS